MRILNLLNVARADLRLAKDDARANLSVNAGVTIQGEDPNSPPGSRTRYSEDPVGGEVVLVYQRPLRYRAERSRMSRHRARIAEIKQTLEDEQIRIRADLAAATLSFTRITERLQLLREAMESARKTVDAESQRFRLGEGRSRNVLDAQRDLTTTQQRQTRAAADLLRAAYDYQYASGYPAAQ